MRTPASVCQRTEHTLYFADFVLEIGHFRMV